MNMQIIQSVVSLLMLCRLGAIFADQVNDTCSSCERLNNHNKPTEECKYTTSCDDCKCGHPTSRPHIILIAADDFGWNDNGFHGSCELKTPNLDALFYSGVVLNRMYTQPVCSPSRAALMTSIYPYKNGMSGTVIFGGDGVPLENKFLSNHMKDMCYKTHIVGKWHLGHYKKAYWPLSRGFDCAMGFLGSHQSYNYGWVKDSGFGGFDIRKQNRMAYENVGENQVDLYDDEVRKIIRLHNRSCPLFLYFAHPAPHAENFIDPYPAKDEYLQQLSNVTDITRRKLGGLILSLDNSVGKLVKELEDNGMLDNSIIFFLSDNGADRVSPAVGTSYPLRGAKHTKWEGGIRSSSVVWSRNITGGRIANDRFHLVDVGPTLVRAAGGTCNSETFKNVDGIDQWDTIINNKPSPRNEIIHDANIGLGTAAASFKIDDKWFKCTKGPETLGLYDDWYGDDGGNCKYDIDAVLNSPVYKALNTGASPLDLQKIRSDLTVRCNNTNNVNTNAKCQYGRPPYLCLFDIENDPCERFDISAEYPEATSKCLQLIEKANSEAIPPRPPLWILDQRWEPKNWCNEWTNYGDCLGMK